ncbi:hypothetical protein LVJ85_09100 [Neisseria sp. Dent CA1/247]|uniref:hypothetical protein n=1 Tax=Neisseria sp. Dent CA1/247 TaxID=2912675 RepID=UPI001FD49F42|nr:hypothetical protein [Neisseria sp. Dent CA1/247]UOO76192.1 hypothetical protein LVJ85_09100 [Neisseria sp. Dent CA1/247]
MQFVPTLALENFSLPVGWVAKPNVVEELSIFCWVTTQPTFAAKEHRPSESELVSFAKISFQTA